MLTNEQAPAQAPDIAHYTLREIRLEGFLGETHRCKRSVTVQLDSGELWPYEKMDVTGGTLRWTGGTNERRFSAKSSSKIELKLYKAAGYGGRQIGTMSPSLDLQSLVEHAKDGTPISMTVKSKKQTTSLNVFLVICTDKESQPSVGRTDTSDTVLAQEAAMYILS